MAQITPVSSLPADSVTTGAVQVTGTGLRISLRAFSGQTNLVLIRMNSSGKWFRCTDEFGDDANFKLPASGSSSAGTGIADFSVTLPVKATNEYYHLLITSGSTFDGYAEILAVVNPNSGGGVASLIGAGGVAISGSTISLGGSADMTLSDGALNWVGAVGKGAQLVSGTAANLRLDAGGAINIGDAETTQLNLGRATIPTVFYGPVSATGNAWAITDPGDGGTFSVSSSGNIAMSSAAVESRTLPAPSFVGQILTLSVASWVGAITVTCPTTVNQAGNTSLVFGSATDSITLIAASIGGVMRWRILANDGVALS